MNLETIFGPSTLEVVAAYLVMLISRAWLGPLGQVGHALDRPAGEHAPPYAQRILPDRHKQHNNSVIPADVVCRGSTAIPAQFCDASKPVGEYTQSGTYRFAFPVAN
jgi:hypothetical protein